MSVDNLKEWDRVVLFSVEGDNEQHIFMIVALGTRVHGMGDIDGGTEPLDTLGSDLSIQLSGGQRS